MNDTDTLIPPTALHHPDPDAVRRLIDRRSVADLGTVSAAGRPHVATVLYQRVDDALYVSTDTESRKGRNIAATGRVAVVIPVRRLPIGPPSSIQFQAMAEVLGSDDPSVRSLAQHGRLDRVTSHGELDRDEACFLRIALPARAVTYGLGMSLLRLLRDPLGAAGEVQLHG